MTHSTTFVQSPVRLRTTSVAWRFGLALLLLVSAGTANAEGKRKVIIDDDGFGMMHIMLLKDPTVEVLGLTSVTGDLWEKQAVASALRGLEIIGRTDVPVSGGAVYPLVNSEALTDRWEALYGKLVWKGAWMKQWVEPTAQSLVVYHGPDDPIDLPEGNPKIKASEELAANFLIRMVHKYPGEITIIAAGPMTNLALAQRLDPSFAGLAKELVYMGGSFNPQQMLNNRSASDFAREYMNSPRREFNIRFDPEAASIMSRSPWKKVTVVPADPATATQMTRSLLDRMANLATPELAAHLRLQPAGFPLWDEIAAAVWIDPTLVRSSETLFVDYNSQFGPSYGDTLSWRPGYEPGLGERKATVVRTIDPERLEALMIKLVSEGKR
jgi:inosine-uridine nucleoside N-ribohydrolase